MGLLQNQLSALSSSSSASALASTCPHNSGQTSPSLPPVSEQPVHQPSPQASVSMPVPSLPASSSTDFSAFSASLPSVALSPGAEHLGSQEQLGCSSCDPAGPSHQYHSPRMDTRQGSRCGQTANMTSSHSSSPVLCPVTSLSPRNSFSSCSGPGCPPTRFHFRSSSETFH